MERITTPDRSADDRAITIFGVIVGALSFATFMGWGPLGTWLDTTSGARATTRPTASIAHGGGHADASRSTATTTTTAAPITPSTELGGLTIDTLAAFDTLAMEAPVPLAAPTTAP